MLYCHHKFVDYLLPPSWVDILEGIWAPPTDSRWANSVSPKLSPRHDNSPRLMLCLWSSPLSATGGAHPLSPPPSPHTCPIVQQAEPHLYPICLEADSKGMLLREHAGGGTLDPHLEILLLQVPLEGHGCSFAMAQVGTKDEGAVTGTEEILVCKTRP